MRELERIEKLPGAPVGNWRVVVRLFELLLLVGTIGPAVPVHAFSIVSSEQVVSESGMSVCGRPDDFSTASQMTLTSPGPSTSS